MIDYCFLTSNAEIIFDWMVAQGYMARDESGNLYPTRKGTKWTPNGIPNPIPTEGLPPDPDASATVTLWRLTEATDAEPTKVLEEGENPLYGTEIYQWFVDNGAPHSIDTRDNLTPQYDENGNFTGYADSGEPSTKLEAMKAIVDGEEFTLAVDYAFFGRWQ